MSVKALKACADYARLNAEIRVLTNAIAEALSKCKGVKGTFGVSEDGMQFGSADDQTHLKDAFTPDIVDSDSGYYGPQKVWLSESEIFDYLREQCPYCLTAYEHIKARKAARKRFGAVKRAIGAIGRAENVRAKQ